jgi:hypothetical protein
MDRPPWHAVCVSLSSPSHMDRTGRERAANSALPPGRFTPLLLPLAYSQQPPPSLWLCEGAGQVKVASLPAAMCVADAPAACVDLPTTPCMDSSCASPPPLAAGEGATTTAVQREPYIHTWTNPSPRSAVSPTQIKVHVLWQHITGNKGRAAGVPVSSFQLECKNVQTWRALGHSRPPDWGVKARRARSNVKSKSNTIQRRGWQAA